MRRTFTLFGTLILLWALVAELNHSLSGLRVYLFAGALYVVFAALTQPWRSGLAAAILGGLMCDANSVVVFGTHALLFAVAHLMVFQIRDRVPRDDNVSAIFVVLIANLALFLVFS